MIKKRFGISLAVLLILALALPGMTGCTQIPTAQAASYKLSLDVNPSIELTVTDGLVSGVVAYNDDGSVIFLAADVVGMTPEDAIKVIVEQMIAEGYIAPAEVKPYLLITVSENPELDEDVVEGLEEAAEEILDAYDVGCKVRSTMVTGSVAEEAAAAGMSIGRYVLFSYIAAEEEISLEEAILTYGHLNMGDLFELFEDAKFAFRYCYADEDNDEDMGSEWLTPEQLEMIKPALEEFKADIKVAEDEFHNAFRAIKDEYKDALEELKELKKGPEGQDIKEELAVVRDKMHADRRAAIDAMQTAIEEAVDKFMLAVTGYDIPEESLLSYLNWLIDKEVDEQENLNDLMNDYEPAKEDEDDEDDDEDDDEHDEDDDDDDDEDEGKGKGKGRGDDGDDDDEDEDDDEDDDDEDEDADDDADDDDEDEDD